MIRPHKTKTYLTRGVFIIAMMVLSTDSVMAQNTVSTTAASTETLSEMMFNFLGAILNILYMITLPVLVIAGKAIDNSLVYGEFINLDRPLLILHQFARTFANFAIGGVLLWKVVKYIFTDREGKTPDFIKGIVIKGIVTVIAVNASWFALGALLDLSTIATYSLGALPLGVLKETNKGADMPILSVGTFFDLSDTKTNTTNASVPATTTQTSTTYKQLANFSYYTWGNINIPSCEIYKGIVIGPTYYPDVPNSTIRFDMLDIGKQGNTYNQYCAINSQVLVNIRELQQRKYSKLTSITGNTAQNNAIITILNKAISQTTGGDIKLNEKDDNQGTLTITEADIITLLSSNLRLADGSDTSKPYTGYNVAITNNAYHKEANNWSQSFMLNQGNSPYSDQGGLTIHTLINSSQGMVGPFVTLYMSLLDYSQLTYLNNGAAKNPELGALTEFLLKGAVSLALFIPLVALAVVLIIRVVLLRAIIAFIPLGIVFALLGKEVGMSGEGFSLGDKLGKVDAKSIIGLIFAPILPVFAISMSIIFLHTLQTNLSQALDNNSPTWSFLGISSSDSTTNTNETCIDYRGVQKMCIKKGDEIGSGAGLSNYLPWLIINMFAIGLMWMMIKFAFAGSQITSKIGESVMKTGGKLLGSIPIMKMPGGGTLRAGTLGRSGELLDRTVNAKLQKRDTDSDSEITKLLTENTNTKDGKLTTEFNKQIKTKAEKGQTMSIRDYAETKKASIQSVYKDPTEQKEKLEEFNNLGKITLGAQTEKIIEYMEEGEHKEQVKKNRLSYDIEQYMQGKGNEKFREDKAKLDSLASHINTIIPETERETQKDTILNTLIGNTNIPISKYIELKDKQFVPKSTQTTPQ